MAVANLVVAVQTHGAHALRTIGQQFLHQHRAVSSVAGAYRDANGLWRQANGLLLTQHHTVTQNTTVLGHMVNAAQAAGHSMQSLGHSMATAGSELPARTKMMMGAIIAAVAALGPAIGAALQGALLVGLGGVGLGAAIVAAFKSDADLRSVWGDLFLGMGNELKRFAGQLVPPLLQAADTFKRAWDGASNYVRDLFGELGTTIGPLADGLVGMFRSAAPGIKEAFATAVPALKEFARMLPVLGEGISSFFSSISDSDSALKGVRFLVLALSGSLMILGKVIQGLSMWFDFWTKAAEKVYSTLAKIPLVGKGFELLAGVFHEVNAPAGELNGHLMVLNTTEHANAVASRKAAEEMRKLSNQMSEIISEAMGVDQAMLAWEEAIDGVTESIKENGRSTDINTEKGRANVQAVLAAVQAAEQMRQASIEAAGGQDASAEAIAAANGKYFEQINALRQTLRNAGLTEAQIDALLKKYMQMAAAPDIRKSFDIYYRSHGTPAREYQVPGASISPGNIKFYASGVKTAPAGWAVVGERGPELMRMRGGETILNARESARAMSAPSAGSAGWAYGAQQLNLSLSARPGVGNDLLNAFIRGLSIRARRAGGINALLAGVT